MRKQAILYHVPLVTSLNMDAGNKRSSIGHQKPKRGQANKRERVRTENVNAGFDNLRKLIPTDPEDRKLSKIEVLRLATSYINHLYNLTRASSCIEAEAIVEDKKDHQTTKDSGKNHVCTFCLMKGNKI